MTLHARMSEATKNMIGEKELALMKSTAYVVNTARAGMMTPMHWLAALKEKRIAGAGLDVLPDEPLKPDSPFLTLDNVTLTTHIAGTTRRRFHALAGDSDGRYRHASQREKAAFRRQQGSAGAARIEAWLAECPTMMVNFSAMLKEARRGRYRRRLFQRLQLRNHSRSQSRPGQELGYPTIVAFGEAYLPNMGLDEVFGVVSAMAREGKYSAGSASGPLQIFRQHRQGDQGRIHFGNV